MLHLALLALAPLPDVLTVDDNPGVGADFTSLSQAIAGAQDGDTLVISAGTYDGAFGGGDSEFVIQGKSLELIGREGELPVIRSSVRVEGLGPGQRVTLRGLELRTPQLSVSKLLTVRDCSGVVWAEDLLFNLLSPFSNPGLVAENSDAVVLVNSEFVNVAGGPGLVFGPFAIRADNSSLFAQGLRAVPELVGNGAQSPGVRLFNSDLVLQGGEVVGATGAPGDPNGPFGVLCAEDGSPAIELSGPGSRLDAFGATLAGGQAAAADPCGASQGGLAIVGPGTFDSQPAAPVRSMALPALGESGSSLPVVFQGQPGDLVTAGVSKGAAPVLLPTLFGALAPSLPFSTFVVGTVGGDGTLAFAPLLPTLPPGTGARAFDAQAAFLTAQGGLVLSNASHFTVVDLQL